MLATALCSVCASMLEGIELLVILQGYGMLLSMTAVKHSSFQVTWIWPESPDVYKMRKNADKTKI